MLAENLFCLEVGSCLDQLMKSFDQDTGFVEHQRLGAGWLLLLATDLKSWDVKQLVLLARNSVAVS